MLLQQPPSAASSHQAILSSHQFILMQHNYTSLIRLSGLVLLLSLSLPFMAQSGNCDISGGRLISPNGTRYVPVCLDDMDEGLTDIIRTEFSGENDQYFLTNAAGFIISSLEGQPPFDFRNFGTGVFVIWSVAYNGDLIGTEVGDNICAASASECFSLSNSLIVNRKRGDDCQDFCVVSGGSIELAVGGNETTVCIREGGTTPVFVNQTEEGRGPNQTFVITNTANEILSIPEGSGPFDLSPAGAGTCLIWYLSYDDGLEGLAVGNTPLDFDGCFNLSNPLTVNRNEVESGSLEIEGGGTEITICAGDGISDAFNVVVTGSIGDNMTFLITNEDREILVITDDPTFDLEGAGTGLCRIYSLSYADGIEGLEVGASIDDINGCYDGTNPITVFRETPNGGILTLADAPLTEIDICISGGSSPAVDVSLSDNSGVNQSYIITNDQDTILALPEGDGPFDLSGAGAGTCRIYSISYNDGLTGLAEGNALDQLEGCFALSNPVSAIRTVVDGGMLDLDVEGGGDSITICAGDGTPDSIKVVLTDTIGMSFTYVITDTNGVILGLPADQPFDLEGAGEGVCLIWALSFEGFLIGAEIDSNATNLSGCFDLSNPITVIRKTGDDCPSAKTTSNSSLPGAAAQVGIFPNPFESEITLELTDLRGARTEVMILDLSGRVLQTRILEMESGRINIQTDKLIPGAYFLRLVNEGGATTRRIIKR